MAVEIGASNDFKEFAIKIMNIKFGAKINYNSIKDDLIYMIENNESFTSDETCYDFEDTAAAAPLP